MTTTQARSLPIGAKLEWEFHTYTSDKPTPGTLTHSDPNGACIMWADSVDVPTYYAYDDTEAWPNITLLTEELAYETLEEQAGEAPARKNP